MLHPVVRRTWAPRGQTPTLRCWHRHDRLSVVAAITVSPRHHRLELWFDLHRHNLRTDDVLAFLQTLRHHRRHLLVVLDRWSVHRVAVRQLLARNPRTVQVEWLPAYAPDLHPVERVWAHTNYADLANYLPDDLDAVTAAVTHSLAANRTEQTLLRAFFTHAGLDL